MDADDLMKARNAAWRALKGAERVEKSIIAEDRSPHVEMLDEIRGAEGELEGVTKLDDLLELKIEILSFMVNVKKADPSTCDKIFHFKPGTTKKIIRTYPKEFGFAHRKNADQVLDEFYRRKISVLENLTIAAPATIQFLRNLLSGGSKEDKIEASRQIQRWTEMFLRNRTSKAIKELLAEDLKKADSEAEELAADLEGIIGGELGADPN